MSDTRLRVRTALLLGLGTAAAIWAQFLPVRAEEPYRLEIEEQRARGRAKKYDCLQAAPIVLDPAPIYTTTGPALQQLQGAFDARAAKMFKHYRRTGGDEQEEPGTGGGCLSLEIRLSHFAARECGPKGPCGDLEGDYVLRDAGTTEIVLRGRVKAAFTPILGQRLDDIAAFLVPRKKQ